MNDEISNMDDLLDDNIGKSLRQLGFIFPRTADDFKRIEERVKNDNISLSERLQDPYSFLGKRVHASMQGGVEGHGGYSQQLAQAARDGKTIGEDIKKKMAEDKLKSSEKKSK